MTKEKNTFLVLFAFFSIYFFWGTNYLAIRWGLESFPPFVLSGFRFIVAGIALMTYSFVKGERFPAGKSLTVTIISGILMLTGGSALVAYSEQYVNSGHAAVIVAMEPFLFILIDRKNWPAYFKGSNITIGLITGFAGIILFVATAISGHSPEQSNTLLILGYFSLLMNCIFWVVGVQYSKTVKHESSNTMISGLQLFSGGMFCLLISTATGEWNSFSFTNITTNAMLGLLYIIVFGSIIAYLSFTWLITFRPAPQVAAHTYINPVVAIICGWLVFNEPMSLLQIVAVVIIAVGVIITNRREAGDSRQ